MESIMRMRIRVPAGTMTLCLPCAAEFVVVAGSAEGPAVPDPSPEFGHAMTIPASRAAGQINEFRIRISSSIPLDRKSTRLNSSHTVISYAVFCLKKKKKHHNEI